MPENIERGDLLRVWSRSAEGALRLFGFTDETHEVTILKPAPETGAERGNYTPDAKLFGLRSRSAPSPVSGNTIVSTIHAEFSAIMVRADDRALAPNLTLTPIEAAILRVLATRPEVSAGMLRGLVCHEINTTTGDSSGCTAAAVRDAADNLARYRRIGARTENGITWYVWPPEGKTEQAAPAVSGPLSHDDLEATRALLDRVGSFSLAVTTPTHLAGIIRTLCEAMIKDGLAVIGAPVVLPGGKP